MRVRDAAGTYRIQKRGGVATNLDIVDHSTTGQEIQREIQDVVRLRIRTMPLEQLEPLVDTRDEPNLLCQLEHRADTTTGCGLRPRRDLAVDARGCQLRSAWLEWLTPSLDLLEPTRNFFLHRSEPLSHLLFQLKSSSVL